ncbi:hypothetical protein EVAR_98417_1 [Eumeta japonica]|uniref:Uncharacterized protein n=1 Tax=Eumeta variegata TaxID=151549 RepID=A0A4C2ACK4_EUMVA|nr:hypothetical protein EVAR_98417_1 [Eumeta japonica]
MWEKVDPQHPDSMVYHSNPVTIPNEITGDEIVIVGDELARGSRGLKIKEATRKLPLVLIRDVRKENPDEGIVKSIKKQNKHATADVDWSSIEIKVKFRRRVKNDLECHPVLEVSSELWRRLVDARYVYVGLQRRPVWDQSPVVKCTQCLGLAIPEILAGAV